MIVPTQRTKLGRLSACRSDLLDNGIDLDGTDHRQLCGLVRRHLEYFQVLGYEADLREVVTLVEDARGSGGGPGGGPGGGAGSGPGGGRRGRRGRRSALRA